MTAKNLFISQLGATTRLINAEIKKQIIAVGAVRTGRMKNNTKVKVGYNFSTDIFTIQSVNSTKYYIFVDKGTIHITPREITDKTLERQAVKDALDRLFDKWIDYMLEREFEVIGL